MNATIASCSDEGFEALVLTSPDKRLAATFVPSLNMICSSLVHDGEDLLYRRAGLAAYAEKGKTCGIPFLHPWANRLGRDRYDVAGRRVTIAANATRVSRDANGLANHGLLGGRTTWQMLESRADHATATILTCFHFDTPEMLCSFPFPHAIEIEATLGNGSLALATTITPAPGEMVPVSFGWHPYFRLPSARESWILDLPVRRRVELDARLLPNGDSATAEIAAAPLGSRTFDDLYTDIDRSQPFAVADASRRIEIEMDEAYAYVQVWAPEASPFVCIEPMTAAVNALADVRFPPRIVRAPDQLQARFAIRVAA
jgi:aldose 1-epimerase